MSGYEDKSRIGLLRTPDPPAKCQQGKSVKVWQKYFNEVGMQSLNYYDLQKKLEPNQCLTGEGRCEAVPSHVQVLKSRCEGIKSKRPYSRF